MQKNVLICLGLIWALAGPLPVQAQVQAQATDPGTRAALDAITTAAVRICTVIDSAGGSVESTRVTGEAKAQINGLLRRLAELGITGQGEFTAENYVGVLRSDLAPLLTNIIQCRREIFSDLANRLLPSGLRPASLPPLRSPAPGDRAQEVPPIVGSYTGEIENTTVNRTGTMSMEIKQDVYGRDLAITMRVWGRLSGSGTSRGQVSPGGELRASGSWKDGSWTFFMNLAGRLEGNEIAGSLELVPSGNTRVSGSEGEFRVRKFVPLVGSVPGR